MYFFDTYALIELVKGNPVYADYAGKPIYTSIFNLYEFFYSVLAEFGEKKARKETQSLNANIISLNLKDIAQASKFRFENRKKKLSYAGALGYVLAKSRDLVFLTGDMQFEKMKNVEYVK
ncbi:MAG: PIN domain-containing protein [Candidatus Diapherotrites archaeon]